MNGKVLDGKHGIETTYLGVGQGYRYYPWYFKNGHAYYYTVGHNWTRVGFNEYHKAYNYIARSRRMRPLTRYGKTC